MSITVLHVFDKAANRPDLLFFPKGEEVARIFEGQDPAREYRKVAVVTTDNLEDAFEATNSIDKPWPRNPGVIAEPGGHRSTSVGDVMLRGGERFMVAGCGFEEF